MSAEYTLVEPDSSNSHDQYLLSKWSNRETIMLLSRFITALGNFSIQYNFQAISVSLIVMSVEQCTSTVDHCTEGKQAQWVSGTATATVFAGAILGQLSMGYLGDIVGLNIAMILTLSTACLAAVCSATLPTGSPTSVYITIIICRFILGAGLGGVYPLSAAKATEDRADEDFQQNVGADRRKSCHENEEPSASAITLAANSNSKREVLTGTLQSAMAFFWQVPGSMTPWMLAYLLTFTNSTADTTWRLLLGLGSIPAALVVALSILEIKFSSRQKKVVCTGQELEADLRRSTESVKDVKLAAIFHAAFRSRDIWFKVLYTGGSWFLYDVCFYGVGLFGGEIVTSISPPRHDSVSSMRNIRSTSLKQVFALSLGIPACALTILLLRTMSTKLLQTLGFLFVAFSFTLLALVYDIFLGRYPTVLYGIYCLLLFSLYGGPIITTFILPAETFPKEIKSTFGGVAAACGKLGAFVGAYSFKPLAGLTSLPFVMAVCALVALLGALLSHTCIGAESPHDVAHEYCRGDVSSPGSANTFDRTLSLMPSHCPLEFKDDITASSPTSSELDTSNVTEVCDISHYDNISAADGEGRA